MIAVLDENRTIFDHIGPWTEEDYLSLSPGASRVELLDGGLLVSPAPSLSHQRICMRLARWLDTCAPEGAEALEGVNLRVGPGRILIPDVLVTFEQPDDLVCEVGRVVLVSEVVSPSNRGPQWMDKHRIYASGRIPWCLLVDQERSGEVVLTLLKLQDDRYVDFAKAAAGETLIIPGFSGGLDPAELAGRRS